MGLPKGRAPSNLASLWEINRGRRNSVDQCRRISEATKTAMCRPDVVAKIKSTQFQPGEQTRLGTRLSAETRAKISQSHTGGSPWNKGKGTKTKIAKLLRASNEFKTWRKAVFERDDYTCQSCLQRGGVLHPHHIRSFAFFPELRFAVNNGQTLCGACHRGTYTFGKGTKQMANFGGYEKN